MSLSRKSKLLFALVAFMGITAYVGFQYIMKPPASIESKKVDFIGTSNDFFTSIRTDFSVLQNKVVVISGMISNTDRAGITIDDQIYCQFKEKRNNTNFQKNQKIKIKGRVIGYDDLLEEVKLDQCVIQE